MLAGAWGCSRDLLRSRLIVTPWVYDGKSLAESCGASAEDGELARTAAAVEQIADRLQPSPIPPERLRLVVQRHFEAELPPETEAEPVCQLLENLASQLRHSPAVFCSADVEPLTTGDDRYEVDHQRLDERNWSPAR
jgi:hypothetical protein